MSWNNYHIPEIDLGYEFDEQSFANIAATLDKNGFGDAGTLLRNMTANADARAEKAVNSEANNVVKEVTDLIKERQYHSKSGYGPGSSSFQRKVNNQHLVDTVKDHHDGNKHRIYANATNGGYNYSQAFEFGLLSRKYPAHHPLEDTVHHLGLNQLHSGLDDKINDAIRKGFS